ncbi:zinc finger protein hangover-like [Musca domestica]|uniref:Zinc finger protein hangover-like n=1 Tax=Musca domestica TaxID=7370 RepID=A0ABM3UMZ8_MUSDO|nr:zinc finger protein hangover-like [Musca domestica]
MSDERLQQQNQQRRHNCCRLCLAPDNECISILNSYAADKEPLASKIHSCVSIKISSTDNLSLRICHACISYLNSWQSFKNRCLSAQNKQRSWLDGSSSPQKTKSNAEQQSQHTTTAISDNHSEDQQQKDEQSLASSILEGISTLKKRKSLTVYPLPAVQIKDEPMDAEDDYNNAKHNDESDEMVDPTMFLERTADEGEEPIMDSSSAYDYDNIRPPVDIAPLPAGTVIRMSTKEAACRACNLKFSTRANARRHEKNLHPHLFDTLEENDTTLNKQTAALNASLELQRAVAAAVAADACKLTSSGVITQQKYRHEVVTAFNNSCEVGYDYDNPEKYQHLLTDEKIVFLQQNDEFIRQYHAMTCRCCNRFYTTYKNFMAHMRKKYLTLPRNCCFNCLKLNDSKALFISHLKKRNCINLHRVLHSLMSKNANFAAAVSATVAAAPEKLRAKELLVNKMYECRLCPKTFRLKLEFRTHVYDEHADAQRKDINTTQCSFCGIDIEDPAERKRHYNNMDCIVTLRCVTCDTKHETQQKFMEHVQDKHMTNFGESTPFGLGNADNSPGKSSNVGGVGGASSTDESRNSFNVNLVNTSQPRAQYFSRMPQACPICGQQYNNYNNVLRHMESKHPDQLPQTYKCVKCGQGYPRLSNLREHMVSAHGADKARHTGFEYIVNADAVKAATDGGSSTGGNSHSQYTGRYDYVMKDLMSITNGGTLADDDGEFENSSKKMRFDGPGSNGGTPTNASPRECPICNAVFANNIGLSNHMRSHQSAANNSFSSNSKSLGGGNSLMHTTLSSGGTQAILKKSLEQAADRRFRRMRCRICQRRFSSKKSYRYHMLNDHQIRNVQFIKCKLCDAEFAYEKGLKVHMFKIHNTLLKDDMIIKQYECEICSIVYRTDVELQHHLANVHKKQGGAERTMSNDGDDYNMDESVGGTGGGGGADATAADLSGISTPVSVSGGAGGGGGDGSSGPLYWYQCKYCPSNFNTNKKLAIHINSHDEFDSNDYSCKDCGNVYSGRKSLWVHRYKKHPQIPEPSECVLCKKVFFDSQMLDHHIPTCNRKPITSANNETGGAGTQSSAAAIYKHKTGDDDEDDDDHSRDAHDTDAISTNLQATAGSMKIKLPEVACTICGARFTDQELFVKHIQMHEQELYTDNPLAAMFDTGPADPNQFYMDRVNDNGEYACDLCSKTFTQMTAFKVHRKWHFRGDNKQNDADHLSANQVHNNNNNNSLPHSKSQQQNQLKSNSHPHLLGLQAVGLVPRHSINSSAPHALNRSQKRKRELKCQYCPSTFISNNNLRRHLFELHKNEIGNLPEPPRIECDPPNMCRKCNVKFESKAEWIEHKVGEARVMKPFGPFQWGCDLCGAYVSRKEKLINHLHNHMKEQVIVPVEYNESGQQKPQQHNNDNSEEQQNKESAQEIHEFKKIKLPGLQQKPMAQMEDDSRDSAKDQYDNDEDGDGDSEQQHESNNNSTRQNQQHQSYGDDDDDDEEEEEEELEEEILEGEFDDLAVGAQQTVGGEEDEEVDLGEDEEDDDDEDDDEEDDDDDDEDDDDVDDEEVDEDDHAALRQKSAPPPAAQLSSQQPKPQSRPNANYSEVDEDDDDDDDEDDDDNDSDEFDDDDDASSTENRKPNNVVANAVVKSRFSCDLCQVYFDTQLELQKHVKMHFLNGPGSVTLTGIKTSKSSSSSNKSRSSSSDVLAVSSS